jgi:hypothetical protein
VHQTASAVKALQPHPTWHLQPSPSNHVADELVDRPSVLGVAGYGGGATCIYDVRGSVNISCPFSPTPAVNDLLGSSSDSTWPSFELERGVSFRDGFPASSVHPPVWASGTEQPLYIEPTCKT